MKKCFLKIISLVLCGALLTTVFSSCSFGGGDNVTVLYTGNINGKSNGNIDYDLLLRYKKSLESVTSYIVLAECGGFFCEDVAENEKIVAKMNEVGYDFAVFGKDDFNCGMKEIYTLIDKSNALFLESNVFYTGDYDDYLENTVKYTVKEFGKTKIAFIGVSSPQALIDNPDVFAEGATYAYEFTYGDDGLRLFSHIESYAERCREKGADYVIVLSNLGSTADESPYSADNLIKNTSGVDAVIDSGNNNSIESEEIKNKDGKKILLCKVGENFENFGRLDISSKGELSNTIIYSVATED